jgi:uncharacterized protein (UPF0548 family)
MPQSSALCSFSYNAVTINAVGSVTLTYNRAPFEVSEIGNANAQFIAGYQNVTAQLDVFYGETDHSALEAAINTAAAAQQAVLTLVTTTDTISGSAFVTAFSVTAAANDVVRASITLQFTGAITAV